MTEIRPLNEDPSSVQAHLTIMQSVIQRMAENSRSCKVWCVTLVAATLVLVARTGEPPHALIALVPTLLFLSLVLSQPWNQKGKAGGVWSGRPGC